MQFFHMYQSFTALYYFNLFVFVCHRLEITKYVYHS